MKYLFLIFFMNLLPQYAGKSLSRDGNYPKTFEDIRNEIAGYYDIAKAIIDLAVYGKAQNRSYERLAVFVDTIGPRLSGSKNLDAAIKYMYSALQKDGLENVHLEPVKVPHWERGEEFAMMLEPRNHSIAILGLGSSVATPPEGITAEVLVVASFDELHRRAQEAKGKIVVYNQPFISYGETVWYRSLGAVEAAKVGAVASLIRSIASFSIDSPHTGWQNYQSGIPQIPTACISVEDAEMMSRMSFRGTKIVVYLKMGARTYPDSASFNTVAEIVGSKYPEQENISNFDIVMESDEGTFKPSGLAFTGNAKARDIVKEIMALLLPINVTEVYDTADGTDINFWMRDGVPGASLRDDLSKYFWFHHSQGDTMTVQDPKQMNLCAAVWAVVSYIIADMEEMLPRISSVWWFSLKTINQNSQALS
ncbi:carboxypeptidase Q isoform X7 [Centrocercus urophasianus]|uniref:carboxypeptidase Q isoform X7 n=1 Tax=Centrocercus urophasianus TaxID=9002 RepID=UPI001C6547F1|nr:carboxypeptidase Q isoform X7 [Centrocercus urophasianus]